MASCKQYTRQIHKHNISTIPSEHTSRKATEKVKKLPIKNILGPAELALAAGLLVVQAELAQQLLVAVHQFEMAVGLVHQLVILCAHSVDLARRQ